MNKSITQDMAYRQSLMKYAEKYGVSRASRKYRSYIYFRKQRWDGSAVSLACQSRRLTAIQTSIRKQNGSSSETCAAEIHPWA